MQGTPRPVCKQVPAVEAALSIRRRPTTGPDDDLVLPNLGVETKDRAARSRKAVSAIVVPNHTPSLRLRLQGRDTVVKCQESPVRASQPVVAGLQCRVGGVPSAHVVDVKTRRESMDDWGPQVSLKTEHHMPRHPPQRRVAGFCFPGQVSVEIKSELTVAAFDAIRVVVPRNVDANRVGVASEAPVRDLCVIGPHVGRDVHLRVVKSLLDVKLRVWLGAGKQGRATVEGGRLHPDGRQHPGGRGQHLGTHLDVGAKTRHVKD